MLAKDGKESDGRRGDGWDSEKGYGNSSGLQDPSTMKRTHPLQQPRLNRAVDWMGLLADDTPLSLLTIPGTHDSAAFTSSFPFIATQKMDILDQLNAGIRYFDLRCAIRDNIVEMVHGVSYLGLTLVTVLETMYVWLAINTSEALVVQIKQDRKQERSTVDFAQAIVAVLEQRPERWRTANTIPLLGALRGRIQLFRRFQGVNAYGLNVTEWKDNPHNPFTIDVKHGIRVTIQDHYTFPKPQPLPLVIQRKGGVVSKHMSLASTDCDEKHWFINFTSAYELNFQYQLTPREIAVGGYHRFKWEDGMNVLLRGSLLEMRGKKTRLGIVAMDFPELGADDLIIALIQSNFDLKEDRLWDSWTIWFSLLVVALLFTGILVVMLDIQSIFQTTQHDGGRRSMFTEWLQRGLMSQHGV